VQPCEHNKRVTSPAVLRKHDYKSEQSCNKRSTQYAIAGYIHKVQGPAATSHNNTNHILLPTLSIAKRGRATFSLTIATRERGQQKCYIGSAFGIRSASQKLNNIILNSSPSNRFRKTPSPIHARLRMSRTVDRVDYPDLVEDLIAPYPSGDVSHFVTSHQCSVSTPLFAYAGLRPLPWPGW
jgi:hypothetical protein